MALNGFNSRAIVITKQFRGFILGSGVSWASSSCRYIYGEFQFS